MSDLKPFSDRAGCKLYHETVVDMLEGRIAELEQQLTELRGELTTVQNAHSKALANNTALRKWITKLEGK